ncbi:MAG: FecR domain-containing protein [Arenibacter latericius]|nr:FecR domain-containing protein [Arenibacter latericius]
MSVEKNNSNPKFLMSSEEKNELREIIFHSIHCLDRKRKRWQYMVAASVVFFLGIGMMYYQFTSESISIVDFANTSKYMEYIRENNVVLITGQGQVLNVKGLNSKISYSSSGDIIAIDGEKVLYQKASIGEDVVYNTLLVPFGKKSKIKLSDGSKIWLNSGSRLVYPAAFNGKNREVYLEGEAIFDVVHDKTRPFLVVSEGQKVEVLGTVFNVSTYMDESEIRTTLKSGSVQIEPNDKRLGNTLGKLKIIPGTQAIYDKRDKNIVSKPVNVEDYFSWINNELVFEKDQLHFIVRKLSRHYNVDIEIVAAELALETFSGTLDLKEDVEKVLRIIAGTTDMEYIKITENQYKINKKELPMK